ncbi:hypothetical protein ACIBH1_06790 [Nonomuraea sp. NPDC050663]|uniref:hypothetical protein n=1 Tax=Nonomuraea sp. NPDC050663 TaxID=3364370 RepID=UPI003788C1A8
MKTATKPPEVRLQAPRRHKRSIGWALIGLLLAVGGGIAAAVTVFEAGERTSVLAVTQALPAGHLVQLADLRSIEIASGPELHTIPVRQARKVINQPLALPLAAGALLTSEALGTGTYPPAGEAVIAVGVKRTLFPPAVTSGSRVSVVLVNGEGKEDVAQALVTAVVPGTESAQEITVQLQLPEHDATAVAAAAMTGEVSLAVLPKGGGN